MLFDNLDTQKEKIWFIKGIRTEIVIVVARNLFETIHKTPFHLLLQHNGPIAKLWFENQFPKDSSFRPTV